MVDNVKYTLIQVLRLQLIVLLLCKFSHYVYYSVNLTIVVIAIIPNYCFVRMPWQGNEEIMIDRFDARAHLDFIRELKKDDEDEVLSYEERQLNYERYRILVQNEFLTSIMILADVFCCVMLTDYFEISSF